jgi:hypothetical protein
MRTLYTFMHKKSKEALARASHLYEQDKALTEDLDAANLHITAVDLSPNTLSEQKKTIMNKLDALKEEQKPWHRKT